MANTVHLHVYIHRYGITYSILISEKENEIDQISKGGVHDVTYFPSKYTCKPYVQFHCLQSLTAYRNRMKPRLLIFKIIVRNLQFFIFQRIFLKVFYNTIL